MIVLASSSPRRQQMLRDIGLEFYVFPSVNFEEVKYNLNPEKLVSDNALGKAREVRHNISKIIEEIETYKTRFGVDLLDFELDGIVLESEDGSQLKTNDKVSVDLNIVKNKNSVIIGCDTVIVLDKEILGKPGTPERAKTMLQKLSGKYHSVFSGLAVINARNDKEMVGCEETRIKFRDLTKEDIDDYVATGEPLDKAGAYGIQGRGELFVDKIEGSFSNVVGLPKGLLIRFLSDMGVYK